VDEQRRAAPLEPVEQRRRPRQRALARERARGQREAAGAVVEQRVERRRPDGGGPQLERRAELGEGRCASPAILEQSLRI
jgi:hypothetical protein